MRVAETAKQLGISVNTLRTWERLGKIPKVKRSTLGWREYTDSDIERIRRVMKLR